MKRLSQSPRSWIWRLASVVLALSVVLGSLLLWRLQSMRAGLRGELLRALGQVSGVRARVVEIEPDLRHGLLVARGITLDDRGRTLLRARELRARFGLSALWHAELELKSVELVAAEFTLDVADLKRLQRAAASTRGFDTLQVRHAKLSVELPTHGRFELFDAQLARSGRSIAVSAEQAVYAHDSTRASVARLSLTGELAGPRDSRPSHGRVRFERARWLGRTLSDPIEVGWVLDERGVALEARLSGSAAHATAHARFDAAGLALETIHVALPNAQLDGRAHIAHDGRLELTLAARDLEIGTFAQWSGLALSGRGRLELQARGSLDAPEWQAQAELADAALSGIQLGHLDMAVALEAGGVVRIQRAAIDGPDWQLRVEPSSLRFEAGLVAADASLRATRLPLAQLYRVLGSADDPMLARLQAMSTGRIQLVYERSSGARTLDLDLDLDLDAVSLAGYRFDRGRLQARVQIPNGTPGLAAGALTLKQMALSADGGTLDVSGSMQHGALALQIALHDLPLARVPWLPTHGSALTGRMHGAGALSGPSARPRAELALNLNDLRLFGRPLGRMQLRSQLRAAVDKRLDKRRALNTGSMEDSVWLTRGDGLDGQLRVDLALGTTDERLVRGRVVFDRLALAPFLPASPSGASVAGTLSAALEISAGGLAHPERLSGKLSVQKLELGQGDAAVSSAAPFELRVNAGALTLQGAVLQGPKQRFALAADGTLAQAGRLIADGSIKASLFTPASEPLVQYFGDVPVHLEWQPGAQPALRGRAELDQFMLQLGPATTIRLLRGALLLSDQRLRAEHLAADFGAGQLELDGQLELRGLRVASYDLALNARRVSLEPQPLVQLAFDADAHLSWSGGSTLPRLTGAVKLKRVLYGKQFHLEAITARHSDSRPAARDRLELDLTLEQEQPMRVRNSFADAELTIAGPTRKLRIVGSDRNLGLLGQLAIARGRLLFQGDQFQITHGAITLTDAQRIAPSFAVSALAEQAKRPDTRVLFAAHGTRDAFKVAVSCQGPGAAAAPPPFTCDYARDRMRCDSFEQLVALWVCRTPARVSRQ
jgi:autotransporter translocation and assembly factor TamB